MNQLPDGSGFFVGSLPLPKDHWLCQPRCQEWDKERDTPADTPRPIVSNDQRDAVLAALRWAIRGATMNGTMMDFDPDALALNAAYALCGPVQNRAVATLTEALNLSRHDGDISRLVDGDSEGGA